MLNPLCRFRGIAAVEGQPAVHLPAVLLLCCLIKQFPVRQRIPDENPDVGVIANLRRAQTHFDEAGCAGDCQCHHNAVSLDPANAREAAVSAEAAKQLVDSMPEVRMGQGSYNT